MVVGILHSGCINLNQWGVYTHSKAQYAQSHQRRFRRWLGNRRIDIWALYAPLITAGLSEWGAHRLYLSLDTTLLWNQFCIVWLAVVYRGRTVPVTWCVCKHSSSTVRLRVIQRVLSKAQAVLPKRVEVVLLADRGFADGDLMKDLQKRLGWHFRIRIKSNFQFEYHGCWRAVGSIALQPGQALFVEAARLGKTCPSDRLHLAFAHDKPSGEFWAIASDEPTTLKTFAQYRLRFQIEENFLDLKSNAFDLEASRLRCTQALSRLCGVIALTMLFLTLQGTEVVESGKRRWVDPHWSRGMSYLKLGWHWLKRALSHYEPLLLSLSLSGKPDPEPAWASRKQREHSFEHEFTVSRWLSSA